uniref:Uncharacterized protein n=1 Tax=Octopus bimaculoides TaxID=37653 RepID=A0A0L8GCH0_OCTBM
MFHHQVPVVVDNTTQTGSPPPSPISSVLVAASTPTHRSNKDHCRLNNFKGNLETCTYTDP